MVQIWMCIFHMTVSDNRKPNHDVPSVFYKSKLLCLSFLKIFYINESNEVDIFNEKCIISASF